VKGVRVVRDTVMISVVLGATAMLAGFVFEQRTIGLSVALGLVVGAVNGELIRRVVAGGLPFVVSSIMRMLGLSAVALVVALLLGASQVALLLGLAAAQFVMVGAAVRQGLRP
jgi:hypothetical protein